MKVTVKRHGNYLTASPWALAADFKFRGMDKFRAWDEFVKSRALKPEIDSREFYGIFASVSPAPLIVTSIVEFCPTHHDALLGMNCQITTDERGVHNIMWADCSTGSNPPMYPPDAEPERYRHLTTHSTDHPTAGG